MKIAYVYDAVYPYVKGGVERRIREIGVRLARKGHEIHLYGMKFWPGPDCILDQGLYLHGVTPARPLYQEGRRYPGQALDFGARLLVPLSLNRFDLIDCQQFPYLSAFPSALAAKLKKSALVLTWHEIWGDYWLEYLGITGYSGKLIERMVASLSRFPVAVSEQTRNDLIPLVHGKPVELIPNGIDFSAIQDVLPSPVESDVVFAGRLIREKHVDMLISAIGILAADNPDLQCIIVGEGPESSALRARAATLGLSDRITFTGFIDYPAMISLMKSSKVFAFPSTREGFGMAALEGLACGLPLVTVDHRSNASRHLVRGETGRLCSLDPSDMAEKIKTCIEAQGRMKPECIRFASGYDWDPIAEHTEKFYKKITEKPGTVSF